MTSPEASNAFDLVKAVVENPELIQRPEAGRPFELVSEFKPAGDQPQAIAELIEGLRRGEQRPGAARRHRLGQDLHHGARHRQRAAADADPRAQQDPGRAALRRDEGVLPEQRRRVLRQLLRLLPARGLRPAHRHLHREDLGDQRADRPDAPLGDAGAARARRRDHRRLGLLHLRHRLARGLRADDPDPAAGPAGRARSACCAALVELQYKRNDLDFHRGTFRVRGDTIEIFPAHLEDRAWRLVDVRRRDREHRRVRPADRRAHRPRSTRSGSTRTATTSRPSRRCSEAVERDQGRAEGAARGLPRQGPAARGRAARAAHDRRPRDDQHDRLLPRHRELLALS